MVQIIKNLINQYTKEIIIVVISTILLFELVRLNNDIENVKYSTYSNSDEVERLERRISILESELEEVKRKIRR
jgi:mannose/fructose/N-acetylgalactosamine-specific phosphotransferase system component IIB